MTWMSRGIRRSRVFCTDPKNSLPFNGGHLLNFTHEKVTPTPPKFSCHSEESGGPWTKIFDIWLLTSGHAMELPLLQQAPLSHLAWGQDAPSCFQLPKMLPKHILGRRISTLGTCHSKIKTWNKQPCNRKPT